MLHLHNDNPSDAEEGPASRLRSSPFPARGFRDIIMIFNA